MEVVAEAVQTSEMHVVRKRVLEGRIKSLHVEVLAFIDIAIVLWILRRSASFSLPVSKALTVSFAMFTVSGVALSLVPVAPNLLHVLFELSTLLFELSSDTAEVTFSFLLADSVVKITRNALRVVCFRNIFALSLLVVRIIFVI